MVLPLFQNKPLRFSFPIVRFLSHTVTLLALPVLLLYCLPATLSFSFQQTLQHNGYRIWSRVQWWRCVGRLSWEDVNNGASRYCFVVDVWIGIFHSILSRSTRHVVDLFRVPHPLDIF